MKLIQNARKTLLVAAMLALASNASAASIGYAQATGYYKSATRPTLYQPLNLLDGRDVTAWCSPTADPLNELLTFGFSGPVELEELRISTGNNFDQSTWDRFGRVRKLLIRSGKQTRTVEIEDKRGSQTIALSPPLAGTRFAVEVLDQHPAEDPEAVVCMSDIVFVAGGKPLNGAWLTTKLKFDRSTASVMGTWFSGYDKTPDRFLSFHFDGTFRYSFEPVDKERGKELTLTGNYDVSTSRIVLETGGKRYNVKLNKEPAKKGNGLTLSFDGEVPEPLKQTFRSVP